MSDDPYGLDQAESGAIEALNRGFARIAGWSFDHRWVVVFFSLVIFAGCFVLAGDARFDSSYEAYFDADDPIVLSYDRYREDFGSDEVSYILYAAPGAKHGPWNLDAMRSAVQLTSALEDEVPFIYQVRTLVNAELTEGVPGGIEITEIADEFPESQAELLDLRDRFLGKPMFVGGLASEDAQYGAIIIEMDRSSTDPLEDIRLDPEAGDALDNLYPQVTHDAVSEILARPEYSAFEFWRSGDVPLNAQYNQVADAETMGLALATSAIVALMLVFFVRTWMGVVGPLFVVWIGVMACTALIVVLGWSIGLSFMSVPNMLIALGVAHSVHILTEFRIRFVETGDRRAALVKTLYLVGTPCLLAATTTAVGFAALSTAPIKATAQQGVYASFGVMAMFFLSLTTLLSLLSFGARAPKRGLDEAAQVRAKGGVWMQQGLAAVAHFNVRHRVPLLVALVAVFAVGGTGAMQIQVDSNWLDDFSYDMPIKHDTEVIDEVMGGTMNVMYVFDAGEPEGIKEPAVLQEIERVQEFANARHPFVRKTYSIVDVLKDLNQAFHDGDPAFHVLPESRELVAQYLLMYESSGGEDAEQYVSSDYKRASLELRLAMARSSNTAALIDEIGAMLEREPLEASTVEVTGIGALWTKMMDYIVSSQIRGFTLAFVLIAAMMMFIFKSFKTGWISMIPNIAPVVLTMGVMGWTDVLLDYSKVAIAAVAIGIAVDDTIHMVSRYRHEFLLRGNYEEALVNSMQDVGRALFITSVALVCGFLVNVLSVLDTVAMQGILLATTIVVALIADFFFMPALVLTFKPFGPEGARAEQPLSEAA